MEFICKVGTPTGEIEEQRHTADTEVALRAELERRGLYVFSVRRALGLRLWTERQRRISSGTILVFSQELSALLKAGLPVVQALEIMLERQRDPVFKRSLVNVRDRVKAGTALSDAFSAEGALYPPMLAASLVAGERSGSLDVVLRRFSQYLRLTTALKRKAVTSAVYPAFLVAAMAALVTLMLVFIIPRFEDFYAGLGTQLPLVTRALIWTGRVVHANLLWIIASLIAVTLVLRTWLSRAASASALYQLFMRLPYLGRVILLYATSQLARTLATLLSGGLPLLNALEVAAASIGNPAISRAVLQTVPLIREGKSLSAAFESIRFMEHLTLEMIRVGEQTGALIDMLSALADFCDEELELRVNVLMSSIEPIMIAVMALLVAAMLLAFYLPLFQAISAIQRTI